MKVVMFIVSSDVMRVVLCLNLLLKWLNMMVLMGWVIMVVLNMVNDVSSDVVLLLLGKNSVGNMSMVVVV